MPFNVRTRNPIYPLNIRTERFRNTFFPYCISQWNVLDVDIRNLLPSVSTFKTVIFEFLRPKQSHVLMSQIIRVWSFSKDFGWDSVISMSINLGMASETPWIPFVVVGLTPLKILSTFFCTLYIFPCETISV